MRRTRHLTALAALAISSLLAAGCAESGGGTSGSGSTGGSGGSGAQSTGPIKIGVVLDVTGAGASLGGPQRQTIDLLTEQLRARGGIDGRPVEVIIEDNQSNEDVASRAMSKLVNQDRVDIVLGASRTGPSLAMAGTAESSSIPMISMAANARIVEGKRFIFKTAQNDKVVLENMVDLARANNWKRIGMVRDASAFGEGVAEIFNDLGKADGISIVGSPEKFAPDATDFTAQMVNLRNVNADANIIWGIPPAAALAQKAYRQLGITKPVMQSHGIGNQVFLDTAGAQGDGLIAPLGRLVVADQLPAGDPQKQVISDFVAAYTQKYPGQRPSTFAGHAHDAFQLAVRAIDEVGTDKAKVRDYLENVKGFVGISGVFDMTPQDHSGLAKDDLVLATIQGSQFRLYQR